MMGIDTTRVRAVIRKELRDYRRKRSIIVTMAILPLLFLLEPVIAIFLAPPTTSGPALDKSLTLPLLYLLLIPVILPSTLAASSVVGEREQGTLEPLLTTPIRRQEFILGKAAAVLIPTMALSYTVFGLFLAAVRLFASSVIASAVFHDGPVLLALFLLAPLLSGWGIVVGMAISVRASEVRVAQQLGTLASFPPVGMIVLLAIGVIQPTFKVAALFAAVLLVIDLRALRIVSRMFDRERLVTGAAPRRHSSLRSSITPRPPR
jgi:ABC-type Na+ efflux pump permease subunit